MSLICPLMVPICVALLPACVLMLPKLLAAWASALAGRALVNALFNCVALWSSPRTGVIKPLNALRIWSIPASASSVAAEKLISTELSSAMMFALPHLIPPPGNIASSS